MFGMSFPMFLALSILSVLSAFVLHVVARYRTLAGPDGFLSKWIVAWAGAWMGSPVFGHWGPHMSGVYVIPAAFGALCGPFLLTAMFKALGTAAASRPAVAAMQPYSAPQVELRKAS